MTRFLLDDLIAGNLRCQDWCASYGMDEDTFMVLAQGLVNPTGHRYTHRGRRQQGTLFPYIWRTSTHARHPHQLHAARS